MISKEDIFTFFQVLLEFKEYATEVDVEFVRKSVRAIGRCAISISASAGRCIEVLLELIQTKVNYVVQEAIVVIRDIFRRYPDRHEGVIGALCDSLDSLDEPEAKASMVWIIGEYADRIDNAEDLLEAFLETFHDEAVDVQLQLLTATVKLFLKKPSSGPQHLIQQVLHRATSDTDDPDLRDRAYVYWRLLSSDPEAAKEVVLAAKPIMSDDRASLDLETLQQLLQQVSTLSSVYHKVPSAFVPRSTNINHELALEETDDLSHEARKNSGENPEPASHSHIQGVNMLADLMDNFGVAAKQNAIAQLDSSKTVADSQGTFLTGHLASQAKCQSMGAFPVSTSHSESVLLSEHTTSGLRITGFIVSSSDGSPYYDLLITNLTQKPLGGFQFQFNKNFFMLTPKQQPDIGMVLPGERKSCMIPLAYFGSSAGGKASPVLQVAVKSPHQNDTIFYYNDQIPLEAVLLPEAQMNFEHFTEYWQSAQLIDQCTKRLTVSQQSSANVEAVVAKLEQNKFHTASLRSIDGASVAFVTGKYMLATSEECILLQITFVKAGAIDAICRSRVEGIAEMALLAAQRLLC